MDSFFKVGTHLYTHSYDFVLNLKRRIELKVCVITGLFYVFIVALRGVDVELMLVFHSFR